jgi:outer membrane protein assembly factor BamB
MTYATGVAARIRSNRSQLFALTALALLACDPRRQNTASAASAQATAALPAPVSEVDILVLPNNMVISCSAKKLTAMRSDGELAWELALPDGDSAIAPAAGAASSQIYLRTSQGLRAASPEGKWLWLKPALAPSSSMPRDASAPVAMSDSTAVMIDGPAVVRLNSGGGELWHVNLPEGIPVSRLKAAMDGGVLVPTTAGLYSVSGDGKIAWRRKISG